MTVQRLASYGKTGSLPFLMLIMISSVWQPYRILNDITTLPCLRVEFNPGEPIPSEWIRVLLACDLMATIPPTSNKNILDELDVQAPLLHLEEMASLFSIFKWYTMAQWEQHKMIWLLRNKKKGDQRNHGPQDITDTLNTTLKQAS